MPMPFYWRSCASQDWWAGEYDQNRTSWASTRSDAMDFAACFELAQPGDGGRDGLFERADGERSTARPVVRRHGPARLAATDEHAQSRRRLRVAAAPSME